MIINHQTFSALIGTTIPQVLIKKNETEVSQSKDTTTKKPINPDLHDKDDIDVHEKNQKHDHDVDYDMNDKHDPQHEIVHVHDDDYEESEEENIEHESSKKSNFIRNGRDSFDGYKDYYLHGSDIDAFRYPHQRHPFSIIDIHGNDRNLDQYDDYAEDQYLNGDGDFQDSHETVGEVDDIEIDRDARIIENEERLTSIYDANDKSDETDSNEADIEEEEKLEQNTKKDKQSQKKEEELNEVIIPENVAQNNDTLAIDGSEITAKRNETNPNLVVTQWVSDKKWFTIV